MTARRDGRANAAPLVAWWGTGEGGPAAYGRTRTLGADAWLTAIESLPAYAGPQPVPAPDRVPPLVSDLPEILAYRALLLDRGTPMDTMTRRVRAITGAAQELDRRPLEWSAEDIGRRCATLAAAGEGVWALLEAMREFWDWHPDHPWVESQRERMRLLLATLDSRHA